MSWLKNSKKNLALEYDNYFSLLRFYTYKHTSVRLLPSALTLNIFFREESEK